jgi:hypothetical protein
MADGSQICRMRAAAQRRDEHEKGSCDAQSQGDPHGIHVKYSGAEVSRRETPAITIYESSRFLTDSVELLARL